MSERSIEEAVERTYERGKRMGLWDAISVVRKAEIVAIGKKDWAAFDALRRVEKTLVEVRDSYVEED